jgi:streptogramin lyase
VLPAPFFDPIAVTAGQDGAIWFVDDFANRVGRLTTSGALSWIDIPSSASFPADITVGPNGNIWFTENQTNRLGTVAGSGQSASVPALTPALSASMVVLLGLAGLLMIRK